MHSFLSYKSLPHALSSACEEHGERTAFIEVNRKDLKAQFSFLQVLEEAKRFAVKLGERGIRPGDHVAIVMQNQSKWPLSAFGVFLAGAVLVPIDYKLGPDDQRKLFQHSKSKLLITEYPRRGDFEGIDLVLTEAPEDANLSAELRWERGGDSALYEECSVDKDDVATIVYSSGTGGAPRGCMLTHANYLAQLQQLKAFTDFREYDRFFSILPSNHAIDFNTGFLFPILSGLTVVHQRTLRPQFLLSTMSDYKVTLMTMVPMLLDLFRKRIEGKIAALPVWKRLMLQGLIAVNRLFTWRHPCLGLSRALLRPLHEGLGGHLRLVIAGGAPTDPSTVRFFYSIGIPVCVGYGLSEAGVAVTVNRPDDLRYDSVGTTLEGTEVRVNAPGADGCGALWVRGPTVMRGYWNEEELTANTLIDGWLHTGDLARLDKHRHLHIYGRMKNMIVTAGGKNVYPEDVEFRFDKVAGCAELAVFAAPALGVQREELVLVYRVNEGASESELLDSFQERNRGLSEYQRISRFLCWEAEFPRTSSMKLKREQLLDSLKQKEVLQ